MYFLERFYFSLKTTDKKDLIWALFLGVIIPNIILFIICSWYGISRVAINIDYLLVITLMRGLRFKLSWLISLTLFFVVFLVDILLIVLQLFPFIKLGDIFYLSTFIFIGPIVYRYYLGVFILLFLVEYILIVKTMEKVKVRSFLIITAFFSLLMLLFAMSQMLIKSNTQERVLGSRALFLFQHHDSSFFILNRLNPLEPIESQYATEPWITDIKNNKPLSNKLLLVVAESWGVASNADAQEVLLEVLKTDMSQFDFFKQGSFNVLGATVAGELRELCQLEPKTFYLNEVNEGFEHCLPNRLKKHNYKTVSLHALGSVMYERYHWYPLAGFEQRYFSDDFNLPKDSFGDTGIFDPNLISAIAETFAQHSKLFYYWLTLTSHTPYPEKDIRNQRFSCKAFNIDRNTESCRNLMLHAQFFDALAELVAKPEMEGVEVIVVGDHSPPIVKFTEGLRTFDTSKVAWIHFKVKSNKISAGVTNDENK